MDAAGCVICSWMSLLRTAEHTEIAGSIPLLHPEPPQALRVGASYTVDEAFLAHVRVDLGGLQAGVTEQLLHDPEVGAAVEEVGGEAVAQGVGVGGHRRPAIEDAPNVSRAEAIAASVEEHARSAGLRA